MTVKWGGACRIITHERLVPVTTALWQEFWPKLYLVQKCGEKTEDVIPHMGNYNSEFLYLWLIGLSVYGKSIWAKVGSVVSWP